MLWTIGTNRVHGPRHAIVGTAAFAIYWKLEPGQEVVSPDLRTRRRDSGIVVFRTKYRICVRACPRTSVVPYYQSIVHMAHMHGTDGSLGLEIRNMCLLCHLLRIIDLGLSLIISQLPR